MPKFLRRIVSISNTNGKIVYRRFNFFRKKRAERYLGK